ncbi:MAG: hypothetical protein UT48_C0001G0081 [Parcubacteria group bacterium GW2011_GWE2_39_37]|uniref:ACT domain-containing protein n=1 Tax=Candidatus Falkowbacteria bacterium GW2011_GWF2_39_8 TaxID=1618642 RepID=A0A0G0SG76_9BACT|nr:MAG: hypothetical protein UT48_C0001G0081 [Parcubacteria group bacterium GW2011_GWE2_39_37]KKR33710.1 MAG: hypothetical protein UT64_C0004G0017 [Candidatus Falkowbacteria bacterium GW2011_GWF2_39_8]
MKNTNKNTTAEKNFPIITVIGEDTKGIVAQISNLLWKKDVNIEEIKQGVIKGRFFMVMAVNLTQANIDFQGLAKELKLLGKKINLDISLYNKEVFTTINNI